MSKVGGYAVWVGTGGVERECDTFTCCHCNTVVFVKPRAPAEESGGFCRMCMKMTCPRCTDKGCTPFEKKLEAMEAQARFRAALTS